MLWGLLRVIRRAAMTAQNIYDDPDFFAGYAKLPRSEHGLGIVYEWPAFQRLLPSLSQTSACSISVAVLAISRARHVHAVRGR